MAALFEHGNASSSRVPRHAFILAHPDADSFKAPAAPAKCGTEQGHGLDAVLRGLCRLGFDPGVKLTEQPRPGKYVPAHSLRRAIYAEAWIIAAIVLSSIANVAFYIWK